MYSLNFSEQLHEAEMEQVLYGRKWQALKLMAVVLYDQHFLFQVSARRCTWLSIFQNVMVSLQGIALEPL